MLEAVIASLVGVIGGCYVVELLFAHPSYSAVFHHAITPQLGGSEAVLLSVGILGATVMPHVIYLHSALTQDRLVPETDEDAQTLLRYTRLDVIVAMTIAGLINIAMLVMAASTFFRAGPAARRTRSTAPTRRCSRSSAEPRACSSRWRWSPPASRAPPWGRCRARS